MDASKTESKVQKHVDEAVEKIESLFSATGDLSAGVRRDRVKEIVTNLALRAALAGLPETCKECEEKLDARLSVRCPKHIGLLIAADFGKAKVKEHGPLLMAKAAMGVQAWFEKITSETKDEDGGAKKPEPEPSS